jgi:hypothetical protein
MVTYNVDGWVWAGTGVATTLLPVTITDDDLTLSPYFTNDLGETINIAGNTYTNPQGGTYELTFTDLGGTSHTEDLLLWYTGSDFIFVPQIGSAFDNGSVVTSLGGWQEYTTGFTWTDVVCFTTGTNISTPTGPRLIDSLQKGDLVITRDNGLQPIRWIGRKVITGARLHAMPHLQPILIKKDAFGTGAPQKDMWLSPQHRVLHESSASLLQFGSREILVPAKGLVNDTTIITDTSRNAIEYIHILFDSHEIIYADGIASESFHPGEMAISALEDASRAELFDIFPNLQCGLKTYGASVRPSISVAESYSLFSNG